MLSAGPGERRPGTGCKRSVHPQLAVRLRGPLAKGTAAESGAEPSRPRRARAALLGVLRPRDGGAGECEDAADRPARSSRRRPGPHRGSEPPSQRDLVEGRAPPGRRVIVLTRLTFAHTPALHARERLRPAHRLWLSHLQAGSRGCERVSGFPGPAHLWCQASTCPQRPGWWPGRTGGHDGRAGHADGTGSRGADGRRGPPR